MSRMAFPLTSFSIEQVPIDSLRPDPANPRRISEAELEALERSIRAYGLVLPILARAADRTVIGGHQRLVAARRAGLEKVPVAFLELDTDQARVLGLALNKIGGEFDTSLLARLVTRLKDRPGVDLSLSGFSEREVTGLLRTLRARQKSDQGEAFDFDLALEEATRLPRTERGDIWLLGDHRLGCGDATKRADLAPLLAGARPAMAFLDPPFNVDLGHHGGQALGRRRRAIANDRLDPLAWEAFVRAWTEPLVSLVDGAIYIVMSSKELPLVCSVLDEAGGHRSDTLIWAKDRFVPGRADYQHSYEPIWYGWRQGVERHWSGARDQGDVWTIARPAIAPLHPVMKPLALMERAIRNSSEEGDLVLDPFLGSGSTLIACERTGRICAGLEIDPVYMDVAIRRWESFTGETAVLDAGASTRSVGSGRRARPIRPKEAR